MADDGDPFGVLASLPDDGNPFGVEVKELSKAPERSIPKQIAASFMDIPAGIVGTPAAMRIFPTAAVKYMFNDKEFGPTLQETMENAFDYEKTLLGASESMTDLNNELLGIGRPEGFTESLARFLPSALLPIPIKPVSGLGKLAHVLTPGFQATRDGGTFLNAGNALRAGTNAAIATGIAAMTSQGEKEESSATTVSPTSLPLESTMQAGLDNEPPADSDPFGVLDDGNPFGVDVNSNTLDDKFEEERRDRTLKKFAIGVGVAAVAAGALIGKIKLDAHRKLSSGAYGGKVVNQKDLIRGVAKARAQAVDQNEVTRSFLESVEIDTGSGVRKLSPAEVEGYVNASTVDSAGIAKKVAEDGIFGQDTGIRSAKPLLQIDIEYGGLDSTKQQIFDQGIAAHRELAIRAKSAVLGQAEAGNVQAQALLNDVTTTADDYINYITSKGFDPRRVGLDDKDFTELRLAKNKLNADPTLRSLAEDFGKTMDDVLEYRVRRNIDTPEMAARMRRENTLDGSLIYLPGRETTYNQGSTFFRKVLDTFGVKDPRSQHDTMQLGNWLGRTLETSEGIERPAKPMRAAQNYLARVIEHANRNNEARSTMFRATGLDIDGNRIPTITVKNQGGIQYIGAVDPDVPTGPSLWKVAADSSDLSTAAKRDIGAVMSSPRATSQVLDESKTIGVINKGKHHYFYVPDEALRNIILTKPQLLGALNQFGRLGKNVLQRYTTGTSWFAPIAGVMNYQLIRFNAWASGESYNLRDLGRGLMANAGYRLSSGLSEGMARAIANETMMYKAFPNAVGDLQKHFKARMDKSIMSVIQREAGNLSTPLLMEESMISLTQRAAQLFGHDIPVASSLARFLDGFKRVMHEAPVTGLIMKQIDQGAPGAVPGGLSPKAIRSAVHRSMDIAGDVRRHGYTQASATFHAWVPWSAPLVQGIGSTTGAMANAVKTGNPQRLIMASAAVMTPMAGALIWNQYMGDEYADYYWNKMTDVQRVNNIYLAVPGLPPEQGMLIPLDPLWSVFNAVTVEMTDAVLQLSRMRLYGGQIPDSGDTGVNGAHIIEAVGRYFDIPVPPIIQAFYAANYEKSASLRLGSNQQGKLAFGELRDIGSTTKYDTASTTRQVDSGVNAVADGMLRALFGLGAEIAINVYGSGSQGFASGGPKQGLEYAGDALIDSLARQARYAQPLFSGMLRSNETDELSDLARWKSEGVSGMERTFQQNVPGVYTLQGAQVTIGDSKQMQADPVMQLTSRYLTGAKFEKSQYENQIEMLRREMSDLRSTGKYNGKPISYAQRNELIEAKSLQIRATNARYISSLQNIEDEINKQGQVEFGRDIGFKFESYQPRPNLGTGAFLPARRQ